jgi:hypothetical protein
VDDAGTDDAFARVVPVATLACRRREHEGRRLCVVRRVPMAGEFVTKRRQDVDEPIASRRSSYARRSA